MGGVTRGMGGVPHGMGGVTHRTGETHIFAREANETSGEVARLLATREHSCAIVEGSIGVTTA